MEIEILDSKNGKLVTTFTDVSEQTSVYEIKKLIHKKKKSLYPDRQGLKLEMKGKFLSDDARLVSLEFKGHRQFFLKDLGPQIRWKTVFLLEYAGPLILYLMTYYRPAFIYGVGAAGKKMHPVVHIASACWVIHYSKRLLETLFVHRFSHGTMPLRNLFKNCSYYWLFGLYIGYYMNHPLYTPPMFGAKQIYGALIMFIYAELGNLSIHLALRDLRRPGTKERKIPVATGNPFTSLFKYVSCPNYTYEVMSWSSFALMTQCFPAALFTVAGCYQMALWALGKHRIYKKEFEKYPKSRKAIFPFVL